MGHDFANEWGPLTEPSCMTSIVEVLIRNRDYGGT